MLQRFITFKASILRKMLSRKNLTKGCILIILIMCYWWFFWPLYEISIGAKTIEILVDSGNQFYLFIVGALVTLPSIFIWKKIIL